jgi:hypothetical protein
MKVDVGLHEGVEDVFVTAVWLSGDLFGTCEPALRLVFFASVPANSSCARKHTHKVRCAHLGTLRDLAVNRGCMRKAIVEAAEEEDDRDEMGEASIENASLAGKLVELSTLGQRRFELPEDQGELACHREGVDPF